VERPAQVDREDAVERADPADRDDPPDREEPADHEEPVDREEPASEAEPSGRRESVGSPNLQPSRSVWLGPIADCVKSLSRQSVSLGYRTTIHAPEIEDATRYQMQRV